jgi:hypothetical protein
MLLHGPRYARVSVARQINQPTVVPEAEKIYQLGAPGAFAGPRKIALIYQRIDGTRLSGIRPADKGNLSPFVRQELTGLMGAGKETGLRVM